VPFLEDYTQLDERTIVDQFEKTGSKNLGKLLKIAKAWRSANLTPVFIMMSEEPPIVACVAEERFGQFVN
jgi:hypothetical protein